LLLRKQRLDLRRIVLSLALRAPARHCGGLRVLAVPSGVNENKVMRNLLLIVGLLALAIGMLLDRSGHRCNRLAAIELHDQRDPVGRLWRGARRRRPDPDLAE
jgi:hypothetical protein